MQYCSTRNNKISVNSAVAIKQGLSCEGGLFVPTEIPSVSMDDIMQLSQEDYCRRAKFILGKFLTDFTEDELDSCVNAAYTKQKFHTDTIAPLYKVDNSTYFLELWHGPTCAFKDMALQILPHLLTTSMKKTKEDKEVVILVATSGDTGKAALEGFKDVPGTKIIVFYPCNGVSEIQKLQMITQDGGNVSVAAVHGNFDDAQNGVKKIFTNEDYKKMLSANGYSLSSANSINWGRLAPQIVYYFSAYAELLKNGEINPGEKVNIVVPTGNFGNILASYYAYMMGLPVNKFICASNENNVLTDFITTGTYDKNRPFHTTISPSMDILISSNLERFLYSLSGNNDEEINNLMSQLSKDGKYTVSDEILTKIKDIFYADCANDHETMETISKCHKEHQYVIDTHTAVGYAVYNKYVSATGDNTKTIIASTASPFKFNQSVLIALSGHNSVVGKDEFTLLSDMSKISTMEIPTSLSELKTKPKIFDTVCEKEQMERMVSEFLNV